MLSNSAVIIDLSNLNVLFRYDGKFCTALNYSGALDRLGSMMLALGPGYDIYLCLKPRAKGEGDFTIPELSISAVPFVADAEELRTVLKYFSSCQGANEVLLCNWLNNYVEKARTDSFDSAFYYGTRVAKVSVAQRLVTDFHIFESVRDFTDVYGDEFNGYGDVGLLDVDGFKAQFPEFMGATKANLVALAPLAHCCSTQCIVNAETVLERLEAGTKKPAKVDKPKESPTPEPKREPKSLENYEPTPEPETVVVPKTPALAVLFVVLSVLLAGLLGASYSYIANGAIADYTEEYYNEVDTRVVNIQRVIDVYSSTGNSMFDTASVYDYVCKSGLELSVVGFERYPDYYVARCDCASEDVFNAFVAYIEENYISISTNDLGVTGIGDDTLHQYSVMFS